MHLTFDLFPFISSLSYSVPLSELDSYAFCRQYTLTVEAITDEFTFGLFWFALSSSD